MRLRLTLERCATLGAGGNARSRWSSRESILVSVGGDPVGRGEAAPVPGHSRDTVDEAEAALRALGPFVEDDLSVLDRVAAPSARFALECALLDYRGKSAGVASYRLLRDRLATEIRLSAVVSGPPREWLAAAESLWERGYRTVKIKLGPDDLPEAADVLALVQRNMPTLQLRLDFNQTLTDVRSLRALDSLRLEFVEEPLPIGLIPSTPGQGVWALDESLATGSDWRDLVRRGLYGVVVLKPSVIGGIARSLALADEIRALGGEVVASYGWEGRVGWSGACALAFALGARRAAGLAPIDGLDPSLQAVSHGFLLPPTAPGLVLA